MENPKVTTENVILLKNSVLLGMVRRDEKTGRPTLYATEPMDMVLVEKLFKHLLKEENETPKNSL